MKKITLNLKSVLALLFVICFLGISKSSSAATLYYHKFEGAVAATPASATYSAAPDTLSNRLSGSSWLISGTNTWSSGTGISGNAILNTNNIASGTYTLTFNVASGYAMDLSGFSTWMRHSTNGPANCVIAVNGTNVASYTSISSATAGVTNAGAISGLTGLTGTVTVTLTLSNAASTGTFRIDNFALYGTVNLLAQPTITSLSTTDVYSGTTLTINGSNFLGTNSVTVGGVAVGSFTIVSNSQISATIGTSGASGAVVVGNAANQKDTSASSLTYKGFITNSSTTYTSGGAWLGGVQPPAGSDITIAHVITVSGTNTINVPKNITIVSGGSIITAGNTVASSTGTITIDAGGSMTLGSNSSWTSSSNIINNGTLSFNASLASTLTLSTGTFTNNGTLNTGAGTIATGGAVTLTGSTTFNNLTIAGATTLPAGSTINGTLTINTGGSLVTNSPSYGPSAILVYGKSSTGTGLEWILGASAGSVGAPESVTVNSGSTLTLNGAGTYYIDGNLAVAGTVTMTGSSQLQINGNMTGGGTFTHGSRKVVFGGTTQTVSLSTTFFDVDVNSSTMTFSGTITVSSKINISAATTMTSSTALTISSTSTTPSNLYGTLLNTGTITISNAGGFVMQSASTYIHNTTNSVTSIVSNSTKNVNSTFVFRGSSALATSVSISNRTFGNLKFESTSGTWAAAPGGGTACTINGDFYVGTGVSLTGSTYTGTITMAGSLYIDGILPATTPFNATLTGVQDSINGAGTIRFGTLNVNGNYALKSNISGTTTTVNGTLNMNSNLVSGTTFTLANGGTLGIGHLQGIELTGNQGNVQTTGTRTYPSNATYIYNGINSQVSGAGLPSSVANLTVNNTGAGANNMVTLGQTTTVTNTLNLLDGHFAAVGAIELIISNASTAAITGYATMALANNSSYVEGNLRRKVTTGVYDFPLGTSQNYQLAVITVNSNTNVDNILVHFDKFASGCGYSGNTPAFYAKPSNGSNSALVDDMLNFGYYTVEPYDATYTLVTAPNISYDAQMLFNGHTNGVAGYSNVNAMYTLMKKPVCGGAWGLYGGSFNTNNNQAQNSNSGAVALKLQGLVSFSQFGGGFSSGTVLPLEMTGFTGEQTKDGNALSWKTLSEDATVKFVIERSMNADDFETIGEVAAKGARNIGAEYSFIDAKAGTGIHYYRLKAVDVDGNVSYSEMIALGTKGNISNFNVYPNPAANEIHFAYELLQANTQATLKVYSMTGTLMHAENLKSIETNYTLDTHEFKNGLYLYEVISEGRVLMTGKFDIAR